MTREEQLREARTLKASGLSSKTIGRQLGVPPSTIRNWCLGGTCIDCGTPVERSSRRCVPCLRERQAA